MPLSVLSAIPKKTELRPPRSMTDRDAAPNRSRPWFAHRSPNSEFAPGPSPLPQIYERNLKMLSPQNVEKLREAVEKRGMAAVCRALGVHRSSLSAVLLGHARPSTM